MDKDDTTFWALLMPDWVPWPVALAIFAVLIIVGVALSGCASKGPTVPAYCTNEPAFTAALLRCVDKSDTREQSRACRKAVHEACGIVETVSVNAHE